MGLFGNFDKNRKYIENRFDVKIKTENGNISLNGEEVNLNLVKKLIEEIIQVIKKEGNIDYQKLDTIIQFLKENQIELIDKQGIVQLLRENKNLFTHFHNKKWTAV